MRLLFVCTGNIDRSPTAEAVVKAIGGGAHETRSAGTGPGAPRPLAEPDLEWADVVAVMEERHRQVIAARWPDKLAKVRVLDIPDRYHRGDSALRAILERRLGNVLFERGGMIGR